MTTLAVDVIKLTGYITEDGKLEVELPSDLPPGEVGITLQIRETGCGTAGISRTNVHKRRGY